MPLRLPSFLLLISLASLAYIPAGRAGFVWDDKDLYVVNNSNLRSASGLKVIWCEPEKSPQYYPMVFTTFWVEYHLWELNPTGYHLVNVLFHVCNSVLVWLLLHRLQVPGAWMIAAIFAVHPVHVESVVWVTERKNVLSGFFYLGSFLAFMRFSGSCPDKGTGEEREKGRRGEGEKGKVGEISPSPLLPFSPSPPLLVWGWYVLSLLMFVAALLSKTVTCSLPAVIVLVFWWKRGLPTRRELLALIPMFAIGLVLARHTAQLEVELVGARGDDWNFSVIDRCLIAGRALWFYVGKLLWPHPLTFNYYRWNIDASLPWQYVYPLTVLAVGIVLALPAILGATRGPLVAGLIFAGTLLPALGFFDLYPMKYYFVADHFQYLASIAMIALCVSGLCQLRQAWPWARSNEGKIVTGFAAGGVLLVLGWLTWHQCLIYQDEFTLWTDTINKNPDAYLAQYNLGRISVEEGPHRNFDLAVQCFAQTIRIRPNDASAYLGWGWVLAEQGRYAQAYDKFQLALSREPESSRPERMASRARILFNIGKVLRHQQKVAEAIPFFEEAVRIDPKGPGYRETLDEAVKANK